jgi:hypothetical protein
MEITMLSKAMLRQTVDCAVYYLLTVSIYSL